MSDIKPNGKVLLVTGINGYIGAVLGSHILAKGYTLRGTARSVSSSKRLLDGPYAQYRDRVEIVEVPDITAEGAFDEAVKGTQFTPIRPHSH
jgi:nucleoside-diphosphate-sugar epimerase